MNSSSLAPPPAYRPGSVQNDMSQLGAKSRWAREGERTKWGCHPGLDCPSCDWDSPEVTDQVGGIPLTSCSQPTRAQPSCTIPTPPSCPPPDQTATAYAMGDEDQLSLEAQLNMVALVATNSPWLLANNFTTTLTHPSTSGIPSLAKRLDSYHASLSSCVNTTETQVSFPSGCPRTTWTTITYPVIGTCDYSVFGSVVCRSDGEGVA